MYENETTVRIKREVLRLNICIHNVRSTGQSLVNEVKHQNFSGRGISLTSPVSAQFTQASPNSFPICLALALSVFPLVPFNNGL